MANHSMDDHGGPVPAHRRRGLFCVDVIGRPATFATAHERAWRELVASAFATASATAAYDPQETRFGVRMDFRTPVPLNANERWDLDNLVKPTLDAMSSVFGVRTWRGLPQAADDRVDELEASKRTIGATETPGARITVWAILR